MVAKIAFLGQALFDMHVLRRERVNYMPQEVSLEVTNLCNFKCVYCLQADPNHHDHAPRSSLDPETCELFLKKVRAATIKTNLIHWTLDGEPFLHKDFSTFCRIGVKYGFTKTYFATNGTHCTLEKLLSFPIRECRFTLTIDFCADKSYFEQIRGTKGSWTKIKRNIKDILADDRLYNVCIELIDIFSFRNNDRESLDASLSSLKELFGKHPRLKYRQRNFHNATGFLPTKKNSTESKYHLCPYPWTQLKIASNGDVVACSRDLEHKTVLGNLKSQDVAGIWNGEPMKTHRRNLLNKKPHNNHVCKGCDLPHDNSRFTLKYLFKTAKGRLQLFAE